MCDVYLFAMIGNHHRRGDGLEVCDDCGYTFLPIDGLETLIPVGTRTRGHTDIRRCEVCA